MRKSLLTCLIMASLAGSPFFEANAQDDVQFDAEEIYKSDMTNWTFSKLSGNETWKPMSEGEDGDFDDWTPNEKDKTGCDTGIGIKWDDDNDTDAWAVSPAIMLDGDQLYRITIWVKAGQSSEPENWKLVVGKGSNATELSADSDEIANVKEFSTYSATKYSKDYTPSETGDYYFGLNCYSEAENYGMYATGFSIDKMIEIETGIEEIITTGSKAQYIDINGYKITSPRNAGLYIKIKDGKAEKVIIR